MSAFDSFKNFMGIGNLAEKRDLPDEPDEQAKPVSSNFTFRDDIEKPKEKSRLVNAASSNAAYISSSEEKSIRKSDKKSVMDRGEKILSMGDLNAQLSVVVSKPVKFEECASVCDYIKTGKTVVVNIEFVQNSQDRKRIFDFVSGCCYALDAKIQRVSDLIYVVAPRQVDVSEDESTEF